MLAAVVLALTVLALLSERNQCFAPYGGRTTSGRGVALSMKKVKDNSVDPAIFDRWHTDILATLRTVDALQPFELEPEFQSASAVLGRPRADSEEGEESRLLTLSVTAYRGHKIDYARLVRISGAGFNVFNFVALPNPAYDLPVFGVDVVVMAGALPACCVCCACFTCSTVCLQYCVLAYDKLLILAPSLRSTDLSSCLCPFPPPLSPLHAPYQPCQP
jgi:VanZ family protein